LKDLFKKERFIYLKLKIKILTKIKINHIKIIYIQFIGKHYFEIMKINQNSTDELKYFIDLLDLKK
jgi:predicted RNA-binding protein associated with RNAse of E/G family